MGKVIPMHGPILINGEVLEKDDTGAIIERKLREAIAMLRENGYRRFQIELRVRGIERPARRR